MKARLVISCIMIGGYYAIILALIIASLCHVDVDNEVKDLLAMLIGGSVSGLGVIVQFLFGSKDDKNNEAS